MADPNETATLDIHGKTLELPLIVGSERETGIDIRHLREKTGAVAFDPGFANTASCASSITFIDGEKGILRYRGIPIEEFEHQPNFARVAWLLIFGELPTEVEYARFSSALTRNAGIDEAMKNCFLGFPRTAPPMAILSAMINALSCFHPELHEIAGSEEIEAVAARLISKIRTIAAFAYRRSQGFPYIYPDPHLPYVSNFLHMLFSQPYDQYRCSDAVRDALNLILILHADHEQNCSTSTVRMVGSSQANLFASCAAGVCALWGTLHGGANVEVIRMLEKIQAGKITPQNYINMTKERRTKARLMGFGHRVYKNFDPRARVLKRVAERLFTELNHKDPLLDTAREIEELALADDYFRERNLYPNVDFYSGIILRAIGIPTDMFTVIFAIGRLPGWIAHWSEQHNTAGTRIARPRQIYIGLNKRNLSDQTHEPKPEE